MKTKHLNIGILAAFIILFASCSEHNDLYKDGLNGNVNSFTEKYYKAEKVGDEWKEGELLVIFFVKTSYNEDGYKTTSEVFGTKNNSMGKWESEYEDGIHVKDVKYNSNGDILQTNTFIQKSPEITECEIRANGEDAVVTNAVYHYKDELLQKIVYTNQEGNDFSEKTYTYDGNNRKLTYKESENDEIKINEKYEYIEFDEKDNWTKQLIYDNLNGAKPEAIIVREYEYY